MVYIYISYMDPMGYICIYIHIYILNKFCLENFEIPSCQVVSGKYTSACDLWSCGVILYRESVGSWILWVQRNGTVVETQRFWTFAPPTWGNDQVA